MALLGNSEARQIQHSWKIDSPRLPDWGLQAVNDLVRYEADRQERVKREEEAVETLRAIAYFQLRRSDTPALGLEGCQKLAQQSLKKLGYGEEKHD